MKFKYNILKLEINSSLPCKAELTQIEHEINQVPSQIGKKPKELRTYKKGNTLKMLYDFNRSNDTIGVQTTVKSNKQNQVLEIVSHYEIFTPTTIFILAILYFGISTLLILKNVFKDLNLPSFLESFEGEKYFYFLVTIALYIILYFVLFLNLNGVHKTSSRLLKRCIGHL